MAFTKTLAGPRKHQVDVHVFADPKDPNEVAVRRILHPPAGTWMHCNHSDAKGAFDCCEDGVYRPQDGRPNAHRRVVCHAHRKPDVTYDRQPLHY